MAKNKEVFCLNRYERKKIEKRCDQVLFWQKFSRRGVTPIVFSEPTRGDRRVAFLSSRAISTSIPGGSRDEELERIRLPGVRRPTP